MIFVLMQIQEKCREQNLGLSATLVDLTKAFNIASRGALWKIPACLGCSPKFLTILRLLHECQQSQVKQNVPQSGSFHISNGIRQGCVLAAKLRSIFFSSMVREASEDLSDGIYIHFRKVGSLFNLRHLLARTKVIEELITKLPFSDDCALLPHKEDPLHHIGNGFSDAARNFDLTISLKKTEVLYPPRDAYSYPHIRIDGTSPRAHLHAVGMLRCMLLI